MKGIVTAIIQETYRVQTFIITSEQPVTFRSGQAMKIAIPGVEAPGRLYSIASPGGTNRTELWFTIGIVKDGKFTPHLLDIKEGDEVELMGPFGKFVFDDTDTNDLGLIAGGTGISVIHSILRHVLDEKLPNKIHLVFSVLTKDEIIFKQELEQLAAKHPSQFSYSLIVTEEHPDWKGACGLIDKSYFDQQFRDYHQTFYICGPGKFIDCAEGILKEVGVPEHRVKIERWSFAPAPKQN